MKRAKPLIILCILPCLLAGCNRQNPIPLRLVEWVHVDGTAFHGENSRYFYQPDTLAKLLMATRLSGQTMKPIQDPDTVDSPEFCITMAYADGRRHIFFVKGDRYIRNKDGPWRQVDPEKMASLHYLLHFQPGDPIS